MQLLTVAAVLAATNSICQSMEMSTIAPDFRSDPMRTLISVSAPWSQIVSTQQGTGAASPLLKDDTEGESVSAVLQCGLQYFSAFVNRESVITTSHAL